MVGFITQIENLIIIKSSKGTSTSTHAMAEDIDTEIRNQVYLNNRQFINLHYEYRRGLINSKQNSYAMIMYAKAYFIKEEYIDCIKILNKINETYSTKILYQKQALLFKATYLSERDSAKVDYASLQTIVRNYERNRMKCPGKPLTNFHDNAIYELLNAVKRGNDAARNSSNIDLQELYNKVKVEQKRERYEGMPSYIVSKQWNKKFNEFIQKNGPYPGPILNFSIMNHVFQLKSHPQAGKQYMDTLLFPFIEEESYYTVSKRHWEILYSVFSGMPIKRTFGYDTKTRLITSGDNLIKTIIEIEGERNVMQWQSGSYWEKSVVPILQAKYGFGQLKEETRNKDFLIIQPGRAEQPYTVLKYVKVDENLIAANTQKQQFRKRKIISTFDMEQYSFDSCLSKSTVGLANLGNTCYLNSALQFISNIKQVAQYFLSNRYLNFINISQTNKDGSYGMVTCAYGDLVKRMWTAPQITRYIDPTLFKRTFGQRYSLFDGNQQQDAQQFLMFLLNCLHQDLNQNAQMSLANRQSMGGKALTTVRDIAMNHYNRHNKSIISELFHGFHYEQVMCDHCKFTLYRFQHYLMLHVQAPPQAPKIQVFVIEAGKLRQAKKISIYTKKLATVGQAVKLVQKHYTMKQQNTIMIPFMYYQQPKQWQVIEMDKDIGYIARSAAKGGYLFIHQVVKPEPDQELTMITYYYETRDKYINDGFPRFLAIKKKYKEEDYAEEVQDIVFTTIPENKIQRDKKDYIKQIKHKKIKDKIYEAEYRVFTDIKLVNFTNIAADQILGQNQIQSSEGLTLEGCFTRMGKAQVIDQWMCEKCKQMRPAKKTDKIYSTSKYLIIQIKRFTENGKITTKVEYPISNFSLKDHIEQDRQSQTYNLQAVILHRGALNYGHYTCIARNKDKSGWLYFDDESVRDIDEKDVVDTNAYILVYERVQDNMRMVRRGIS